jgi:bisphosphoglycerate-independent phosphoglycerate mutase
VTVKRGPLALIIIDGWGYRPEREGNAIALASKPFYDELLEKYPHTLLEASGSRVGLPAGIMGNSEVGHLNMGSGRVIRMDVSRIDYAIETGEFFGNPALTGAVDAAQSAGKALHLMGLVSDGQVHSSQEHLYALLRMAKERGLQRVYVHCFLDGRDTPSRPFRSSAARSARGASPPSSAAITLWTATSAGSGPSAPINCLSTQKASAPSTPSRRSNALTSAA